ncbi:MAG: ATP-binding cassette domain-containing protein [Burkholderiaceae bacterium]
MSAALDIDRIEVGYASARQRSRVLHDFSLQIEAGAIGCLLGPSGCGKTTVLRAIAGFEPVVSGTIRLGGVLLSAPGVQLPPEQRRVGMMFQEYALFPHLTAAQNVAFGLRRLARDARVRRTGEMLALVGLADAGSRLPHQLSGGQQQRIALARALAPAPALLLLDEPFSNLDTGTRERLGREVRAICKLAGQTAILVTHNEAEAHAMADRIGVMHDGKLTRWQPVHAPAAQTVPLLDPATSH